MPRPSGAQWQSEGSLAALWQAWPEIAGAQLAPHCRPLALRGNTLVVGASQPQWLQALRYSRHQLLAVLRSRGYAVGQLQFQQHDAAQASEPFSAELDRSWSEHPCRITGAPPTAPAAEPRARAGKSSVGAAAPSACTNQAARGRNGGRSTRGLTASAQG